MDEESKPGFVSDYNLVVNRLSDDDGNSNMSLTSWQAMGYDTHSQIVQDENIIFVNPANSDYHLLESSQPTNIGTSLVSSVVNVDLDGVVRPQESGYDIGAYEFTPTTPVDEESTVNDFKLYQNYPNPFNPSTKIQYAIGDRQFVTLKIYNAIGKDVAVLVNEVQEAGIHSKLYIVNSTLPSGVYFYQLKAGNFQETKKMILIK